MQVIRFTMIGIALSVFSAASVHAEPRVLPTTERSLPAVAPQPAQSQQPEPSQQVEVQLLEESEELALEDDPPADIFVESPVQRDYGKMALGIGLTVLGGAAVLTGAMLAAGPALQVLGGGQCNGDACLSDAGQVAAPCLLIGGAGLLAGGIVLITRSSTHRPSSAASADLASPDVRVGIGSNGASLQLTF